ncbi:MAG TPA: tetratricopeptide repeat protein, partial [Minicystis sp.]|nr:tetratricopeptide repeat protein [Minicystis sp.]
LGVQRLEVESSLASARIVADHGVGKSRLLAEFLNTVANEGDLIVQVGPDPWWAEVGNYALRRAIVGLAGLPFDGGGPQDWSAATPEARRGLADIFGKGDGRRDSARPHVWTKPPAGSLTPEEKRFIAAEALRWAMVRAHQTARKNRVILAIDDLHAVDGSSRNAFTDVIHEPPLAPMLVLATHVPGFEPNWPGAVRNLAGLPTQVAASLVKGSGAPKAVNSDGRTVPPLYIDQLIRYNLEGGSDPPARMADLIALRIERLPIDARRTLQAVAVLGDATDRQSIAALLPEIGRFDDLLATLTVAGLVAETAEGIRIAHPLVRDVTLATIPAGVRRELHATAHELPAGPGAPAPLEVQALHAFHAQNSFEALMLLEQVADRAAARGDQQGCVLALRRGLDLARREIFRGELDDPMRAVLIFCRKLGEALARSGDLTDADGVLREALDLAGPSGPDRAVVLATLAFVSRERSRTSEASHYLREALDLAKQGSAPELLMSLERLRREWMTRP